MSSRTGGNSLVDYLAEINLPSQTHSSDLRGLEREITLPTLGSIETAGGEKGGHLYKKERRAFADKNKVNWTAGPAPLHY
jgi:hypothetical protein